MDMRVSDDYFNGSDQSYLSSRIFQDGFYQISGRRLTLRSGDADRRQFFAGWSNHAADTNARA